MSAKVDWGGNSGELTLKRMLMIVPLLAAAACTTDDLDAFAYGLNQAAYELDAQMNAPCPVGMFRQHVPDTLPTSYPRYSYEQVGYQLNPLGGGYSYCAVPVYYTHDDDHDGDRGDRHDDEYSDGYRDGYRDGRRDN
jgi:hypothetical protein